MIAGREVQCFILTLAAFTQSSSSSRSRWHSSNGAIVGQARRGTQRALAFYSVPVYFVTSCCVLLRHTAFSFSVVFPKVVTLTSRPVFILSAFYIPHPACFRVLRAIIALTYFSRSTAFSSIFAFDRGTQRAFAASTSFFWTEPSSPRRVLSQFPTELA
jgi:hypothetical protein